MPIGFSIGPLFIHYYGIIIMLGVLVATWVAAWQALSAARRSAVFLGGWVMALRQAPQRTRCRPRRRGGGPRSAG
jgi:hypothetical protein